MERQGTNSKLEDLDLTMSIFMLNINDLNISTQRQRILDCKKGKIQLYAAYNKHTLNIKAIIGYK